MQGAGRRARGWKAMRGGGGVSGCSPAGGLSPGSPCSRWGCRCRCSRAACPRCRRRATAARCCSPTPSCLCEGHSEGVGGGVRGVRSGGGSPTLSTMVRVRARGLVEMLQPHPVEPGHTCSQSGSVSSQVSRSGGLMLLWRGLGVLACAEQGLWPHKPLAAQRGGGALVGRQAALAPALRSCGPRV